MMRPTWPMALVEQHLVVRTERLGGTRFSMFETVREFCRRQLDADPAAAVVAARRLLALHGMERRHFVPIVAGYCVNAEQADARVRSLMKGLCDALRRCLTAAVPRSAWPSIQTSLLKSHCAQLCRILRSE